MTLSGRRCFQYDTKLSDWYRPDIPTVDRSLRRVIECVRCYWQPGTCLLHDTRFVGENFREREHIKRRFSR